MVKTLEDLEAFKKKLNIELAWWEDYAKEPDDDHDEIYGNAIVKALRWVKKELEEEADQAYGSGV